jgi:competence protein ComEC
MHFMVALSVVSVVVWQTTGEACMTQATREGFERETVVAPGAATPVLGPGGLHEALPVPRHARRLSPPPLLRGESRRLTGFRTAFAAAATAEKEQGLAFLFLPVAMGTGAGLFYMAPVDPPLVLLAAGLIVALLVAVLTREHHVAAGRSAGYAAALLAGGLASGIEVRDGAVLLDSDVTTTITGTVEAREFDPGGRVRYLVRLTATAEPEIRRPPVRVRLAARSSHRALPVGAMISGRARLSAPSGPVIPGGYDFAFRAFVDGIGAQGFFYRAPVEAVALPGRLETAPGWAQSVRLGVRSTRERISARIRQVLPGDPGGIAAALAVSDRRGISEPVVEALRATGLAHILAISGLHMALAAGTLYIGIRKSLAAFPILVEAFPVKKFAAIGAMLTATAYLLISGGSVATQRAWVMLTVMLVAVLADRPALTMRNVALAAIVIILISPSAVVGPGFQMSFAATAALISAYAAIARRARSRSASPDAGMSRAGPRRWFAVAAKAVLGLAITSLVAGLATGLFSAHHFHRVAGNGLLANLMAMPLVTFVVMPAGLLAMLLMPFGLDAWPLYVMGQGLEGVIAVANYVHALGGDFNVGQIPMIATLLAGAGFVILVFLRSRLRLAGLALIGLGAVCALPPVAAPTPDILVSENGDLVGLAGPGGLASNAARPSEFVFSQWRTALRSTRHLPPVAAPDLQNASAPGAEPNAGMLDQLLAAATGQPSRFHCAGRGICAAIHARAAIVTIDDAALIGAACDRADLVIVAIPVYLGACRSGAKLVTSRTLRRSGALAITVEDKSATAAGDGSGSRKGRPSFRIEAALQGVVRPWTIQRYYDWRTGRFDLPG